MLLDYGATNELDDYFSDRQYEQTVKQTKRQPLRSEHCAFEDLGEGD